MTGLERDVIVSDLFSKLAAMERRLERLERALPGPVGQAAGNVPAIGDDGILDLSAGSLRIREVDDDVSSPPTEAQVETALGAAEDVGAGYLAAINDAGSGNIRLYYSDGTAWQCTVILTNIT